MQHAFVAIGKIEMLQAISQKSVVPWTAKFFFVEILGGPVKQSINLGLALLTKIFHTVRMMFNFELNMSKIEINNVELRIKKKIAESNFTTQEKLQIRKVYSELYLCRPL